MSETSGLTVLGQTVQHAIEHVEVFPAPKNISSVMFDSDEVQSFCPVTGQPDISSVSIEYVPNKFCIESKSLKLYLWGFRDRAVFAEALAAEIASEVMESAKPHSVRVVLVQSPRGGITITAVSELGK
jgi:7-cyano-7-deazaguanine reductase